MTVVNAVASTQSATATTAKSPNANYETFLQLLITELKNQDPTKPLDPTQTVSQLATFSSVEQAVRTNALLSSMATNSALSQASALIGRTVTTADGATSGVIRSVLTSDSGLSAILADGSKVDLASGMTIS